MQQQGGYPMDHELEKLYNRKMASALLHLFVLVVSLATFGICAWIRFDLDFREWVWELDW